MSTGTIITFYSWKGGVGRSMALANVAIQLAQRGRSVLMIDWDLEAPGLDRYFASDDARKFGVSISSPVDASGLVGVLESHLTPTVASDGSLWRRRLRSIELPKLAAPMHGSAAPTPNLLHLLPSGDGERSYAARLERFSWNKFYAEGDGAQFIESIRSQWAAAYDFVLIDSRTGLTDSGGVCTIQMPDWLVLVFSSNEQSLDGGLKIVEGIQRARQDFAFDRMPLNVVPLLSRWDGENEIDLAARWLDRTAESTRGLFEPWLPATLDPRRYFERVRVPHLARFSFGEPLPVVTHSTTDESLPGVAYARLAQLIDSRFADAGIVVDPSYRSPVPTKRQPEENLSTILSNEEELARETRLQEQRLGSESRELAEYLFRTANALHRAARFSEAEVALRRALSIDENIGGRNDLTVAFDLLALADLLRDLSRLREAESLYRRAIDILETKRGPDDPALAAAYNNMAGLLETNNKIAEAERLYRRSISINEQNFGPDHPEVATGLNNLAKLLSESNRTNEAERLFKRSLAIDEASYGPDHTKVAVGLNNLAGLLQDTGRLKEAEPLLRRGLAIDEASYGPDHPSVAIKLSNLAGILGATGRRTEAEAFYRRALMIDEASYGPNHPKVATDLANLASLLSSTSRSAEAEPLLRRALAIDELSYGPDHPQVGNDLSNLGVLLKMAGRYQEAEPLQRRALAVTEQSYRPDHPSVANRLNNLGTLLNDTGRPADAERLFRRAINIVETSFGESHPNLSTVLNNLAEVLADNGQSEEAEQLYRRALSIDEEAYGPDHPEVALDLNNLAHLLSSLGRFEEALPYSHRAVRILVTSSRSAGLRLPHLDAAIQNHRALLSASGLSDPSFEGLLAEGSN